MPHDPGGRPSVNAARHPLARAANWLDGEVRATPAAPAQTAVQVGKTWPPMDHWDPRGCRGVFRRNTDSDCRRGRWIGSTCVFWRLAGGKLRLALLCVPLPFLPSAAGCQSSISRFRRFAVICTCRCRNVQWNPQRFTCSPSADFMLLGGRFLPTCSGPSPCAPRRDNPVRGLVVRCRAGPELGCPDRSPLRQGTWRRDDASGPHCRS